MQNVLSPLSLAYVIVNGDSILKLDGKNNKCRLVIKFKVLKRFSSQSNQLKVLD